MVLLSVPDEEHLCALVRHADVIVNEPDLQGALTALGFLPSEAARKILRKLPLALREHSGK